MRIDRLSTSSQKRKRMLGKWRILAHFGAFWEGLITDR